MPECWRRRELRWKVNKDYDGGLPRRRSSHFFKVNLTKHKHFSKLSQTIPRYTTITKSNKRERKNNKMSKFVEANEKIAEKVVEGYKKIENGVVGGYKKIEEGVVDGFTKVTDKCVEKLFAREGESVEDAKKRLSGEE